jgi:hypothetical protein
LAESLGKYLAEEKVVTFFLGAGASQSSGAPSTGQIYDALLTSYPDLEANVHLEEGLDAISEAQIENCIRPLFEDVRPHLGYLSLAGLAKSTRVLVANLNWDSGVENACDLEGVECASVVLDERNDLQAGLEQVKECLADQRFRVVNLHLHGRLGHGDIRLARKNTLSFHPDTTKLLWNYFFRHPTVVAGASLTGEYDVTGLLTSTAVEGHRQKKTPFWLFSRQAERTEHPEDAVATDLLSRNDSSLNFAGDPFVDFDRLMIEVLAQKTGRSLKEAFDDSGLAQPKSEEIVLPSPDLLREHLGGPRAGRVLVLVGERKIGKSTTARMLAHWISARFAGKVEIETHFHKGDCTRAVTALLSEKGGVAGPKIVIFDDPFGDSKGFDVSETFVKGLLKLVAIDGSPRVMLTCSPANWYQAREAHPDLGRLTDIVAEKPTEWYQGLDLAALADSPKSAAPVMVTRRVLEGVCSTPSRALAANRGVYPNHDDEVIAEKLRLLRELDGGVQEFLALVRFYELSRTVMPQIELANSLHASVEGVPACTLHMLKESKLDGEPHWQFAHYTDRAAFDGLYTERRESLFPAVVEVAYGRDTVKQVCEVWAVVAAVRAGEIEAIRKLADSSLVEWGPLILEEAANSKHSREKLEEILEILLAVRSKRDFWSLRELVYEMVRLWPELRGSAKAQAFLDEVLDDRERLGVYCVFEAILYFQEATHSGIWDDDQTLTELWERLSAARWDLIRDVEQYGTELALMIDALAWSRPPILLRRLRLWMEPMLDALEAHDESWKGAIALACLYHPDGVELFKDVGRDSPLADIRNLNEPQMAKAAEMVRWHFVHQSRGRALLIRRRLEPAIPELLRRVELSQRVPSNHARAIREFVTRMAGFSAHRGWAIHLGFNLLCTAGEFDDAFLGDLLEGAGERNDGIVTAALTYQIPNGALDEMQRYFSAPQNTELLLAYMLEGYQAKELFPSARVRVVPPRFMAGRSPQSVHRQLGTQWSGMLAELDDINLHDPAFPREVHEILVEASDLGHIHVDSMWEVMRYVSSGVYTPLASEVSRQLEDQALDNWLKGKCDLARVVVLVALEFDADRQLEIGDGPPA